MINNRRLSVRRQTYKARATGNNLKIIIFLKMLVENNVEASCLSLYQQNFEFLVYFKMFMYHRRYNDIGDLSGRVLPIFK